MEKEKAKQALAEIKLKVTVIKQTIASLRQDKQKIKSEIRGINTRKKVRLTTLQNEINKAILPQQKKIKRTAKEKEKQTFDNQIIIKEKQIERVDNNILSKEKEIADFKNIEQRIKLAMLKKDLEK